MKSIYVVCVLMVLTVAVSGGRRNRDVCRYGAAVVGQCDPVNRTQEVRKALLPGVPTELSCEPFKIKMKRCKPNKANLKCLYGKRIIGECDRATNTMLITFPLLPGQNPSCPEKSKTKPCKKPKNKCKYDKSADWDISACPQGNATRTLNLKPGQDTTLCEPTRVVSVRCRKHERKMNRKTKKKEKKKQRRQERRRQNRKDASPGCKYTQGDWSDCDMTTDTMSRTMTLISGDDVCEQTIIVRGKCRKSCKYARGQWGDCNPSTKLKERVDTLKPSVSKDFCESTRKIHKKCGKKAKKSKKGCVYQSGPWGECNVLSGQRTKTKTLSTGDVKKCVLEKTVSRPCAGPRGQERCFFGPWQEWEECRNGVQRKQREVLQGGDHCQRKRVKTRSCTENS
ncbi:uncharacterized protein LOC132556909 isoform X2 [Ylistrum balloti]|uniref:uncharacterized protein LOC132556909 isoform X2 n=1 Tax=Ylistrum balloti TaxID=509963 RepID=UPI002905A570|nr:uncharacterized protein LOC132556909 isoform X2 [Ylistrum balloti]